MNNKNSNNNKQNIHENKIHARSEKNLSGMDKTIALTKKKLWNTINRLRLHIHLVI